MNRSFMEELVFEVMKTNKGIKNMPGVETGRRLLLSCAGGIEKNLRICAANRKIFYDNKLSLQSTDTYRGSA